MRVECEGGGGGGGEMAHRVCYLQGLPKPTKGNGGNCRGMQKAEHKLGEGQVVGIEGDPPVPTGLTRSWERLLPAAALELGKQPGQIGAGVRASEHKRRAGVDGAQWGMGQGDEHSSGANQRLCEPDAAGDISTYRCSQMTRSYLESPIAG